MEHNVHWVLRLLPGSTVRLDVQRRIRDLMIDRYWLDMMLAFAAGLGTAFVIIVGLGLLLLYGIWVPPS